MNQPPTPNPADYEAIENPNGRCYLDDNSKRCAFYDSGCDVQYDMRFPCIPSKRLDNKHVIFIKKEPQMKPFDLEAAINGAPVVTRDGREVKQLTYFVCDNPEALVGVVGDTLRRWYNNGSYIDYIDDSPFDLFMAPQKARRLDKCLSARRWL